MKKIIILFAVFIIPFACSSQPETPSYTPVTNNIVNIDDNNFTAYTINLPAYGYILLYISNYSQAIDTSSDWWRDAVIYEAFIRSFKNNDGDSYGDLAGVTSKLDYLTNVGFDAVWTTPVFSTTSTHGYDITDYYNIDSDCGDMTDFNNYITEAHNRGVKVILDMVLNHTGSGHDWFQQSISKTGGYTDWYVWTSQDIGTLTAAGWCTPWLSSGTADQVWKEDSGRSGEYFYAAFWSGMPDLNLNQSSVKAQTTNIAKFWLDKGVDGFRLDAVRYFIETGGGAGQRDTQETIDWLRWYNTAVKSFKSDAYLVAEAWCDTETTTSLYYDSGQGVDQAFSFHFMYDTISSINNGSKSALVSYINNHNSIYAPWGFFAPFMDNHDEPVGGNNRLIDNFSLNFNKIKLYSLIMLTFPGTPFVYYGSEVGMAKSSAGGDTAKRSPMVWSDDSTAGFGGSAWTTVGPHADPYNVDYQAKSTNSLLVLTRSLIKLRKQYAGLRRGTITPVQNDSTKILSYIRPGTNGAFVIVANLSSSAVSTKLDFTGSGLSSGTSYVTREYKLPLTTLYPAYAANYSQMNIRGTFNGWGLYPMTLTADHTWTVSLPSVLSTDQFKFCVYSDWTSGYHWGDDGADGIADVNSSANIVFGTTGAVTVTFNDQTLVYTVN